MNPIVQLIGTYSNTKYKHYLAKQLPHGSRTLNKYQHFKIYNNCNKSPNICLANKTKKGAGRNVPSHCQTVTLFSSLNRSFSLTSRVVLQYVYFSGESSIFPLKKVCFLFRAFLLPLYFLRHSPPPSLSLYLCLFRGENSFFSPESLLVPSFLTAPNRSFSAFLRVERFLKQPTPVLLYREPTSFPSLSTDFSPFFPQ